MKAGDVEFCISFSVNGATVSPQASTSPAFIANADPYLDKLAQQLGSRAEKIKDLIRVVN